MNLKIFQLSALEKKLKGFILKDLKLDIVNRSARSNTGFRFELGVALIKVAPNQTVALILKWPR